jgi:hypothetical protein
MEAWEGVINAITGVDRSPDGRAVTLKYKKGSEEVLKLEVEYLVLEGDVATLLEGFRFANLVKSPEGQRIFPSEFEAIDEVNRPVFAMTGAESNSAIMADLTTTASLYCLKGGVVGKIRRTHLTIYRGKPADGYRAGAIVSTEYEGRLGTLFLSLLLPDQQFDRLFRTIWSARLPCRLGVQAYVVGFGRKSFFLLDADLSVKHMGALSTQVPVKMGEISATPISPRTLAGPLPAVGAKRDSLSDAVEDNIWQINPTVGAIRQLQSTILSIRKALWWLLGLVVFIAVILFLRG